MNATVSQAQIPSALPEMLDKIVLHKVLKTVNHVDRVYIESMASGISLGSWLHHGDWSRLWLDIMNDLHNRGVRLVDEIQLQIERLVDEDILLNVEAFYDAARKVFPGIYAHACEFSEYLQPKRSFQKSAA